MAGATANADLQADSSALPVGGSAPRPPWAFPRRLSQSGGPASVFLALTGGTGALTDRDTAQDDLTPGVRCRSAQTVSTVATPCARSLRRQHLPSCLHMEPAGTCTRSLWCLTVLPSDGTSARKAAEGCIPETIRGTSRSGGKRAPSAYPYRRQYVYRSRKPWPCVGQPPCGRIHETPRSSTTPSMGFHQSRSPQQGPFPKPRGNRLGQNGQPVEAVS